MQVLLLRVPSTGANHLCTDPPISQGLVAAALRDRGIDCEVIDLSFYGDNGIDLLIDALEFADLRIIGISVYQTNIERCLQVARLIKQLREDIVVVMGGPQATHMPRAGLEAMPMIDGLCRGAGEEALPRLVTELRERRESIPGFLMRTPSGLVEGSPVNLLPPVDNLPSPFQMEIWPLSRYPLGVMFSNRGCPYACNFCYTPAASGRRLSQRSKEGVLRDILSMAKAGVKHIFFADPVFVTSQDHSLQLLNDLHNLQTKLTFNCELRTEAVNPAQLNALRDAGFISVSYGLETTSSAVLEGINKHIDLKRFREVVDMTLDHGIMVELFCIHSLPGQTLDDVRETFDFIESCGPAVQAAAGLQQLQLYFGIKLLDDPVRYGIEIIGNQAPYLSPATSFRTTTLGPEEAQLLEQEWQERVKPARELFGFDLERTNTLRH